MLVVDVGFAACGGKAHIHHKYLRTAVECRFIEHGRPPIYRVDTAGGRSFEEERPAKKARSGVYVYREYTRSWRQLDGSMSGRGDLCDRSSSDKVTVRAAFYFQNK